MLAFHPMLSSRHVPEEPLNGFAPKCELFDEKSKAKQSIAKQSKAKQSKAKKNNE